MGNKSLIFFVIFAIICNLSLVLGDKDGPTVGSPQGTLKGLFYTSRKGRAYEGYLGIPFGTIPKRFEAGELAGGWEGTKDATQMPKMCFQYFNFYQKMVGEEQCLKLNVYTPNKKGKLPVMVWLFPGGFQLGGASMFEAKYMMDADVVFVPINYRLGALGFLNTGEGSVSANNGLKDALLALRWVSANIAAFGGDPSRVTIFGLSAGGAAVHYLTLSPLAKGLFHRAISFSGSALNPWAFQADPKKIGEAFVSRAGCDTPTDWPSRVECLRKKTPEKIVEAQLSLMELGPDFDFLHMKFVPSIESPGSKAPHFLTSSPSNLLTSGDIPSKDVPYIWGITENEGAFWVAHVINDPDFLSLLNRDFDKMAPLLFYYDELPADLASKITRGLKRFYLSNKKVTIEGQRDYSNIFSDRFFGNGIAEAISRHGAAGQKVWPYILDYKGSTSLTVTTWGAPKPTGVGHADDLMYMFNATFGSHEMFLGTEDGDFSEWFVDMLANFATKGEPGVEGWEELGSGGNLKFYSIEGKDQVKLVGDPLKERRKFWQNILGEKEREEL